MKPLKLLILSILALSMAGCSLFDNSTPEVKADTTTDAKKPFNTAIDKYKNRYDDYLIYTSFTCCLTGYKPPPP